MTCLGCNLIETAPVTLIDGTTVCSSCEGFRHECEARNILALPHKVLRRGALIAIEARRGKEAADALRETMTKMWKAE